MDCPICGKRCSQHVSEAGTWYWCPTHGAVKVELATARQAKWEQYVEAMERHDEAQERY